MSLFSLGRGRRPCGNTRPDTAGRSCGHGPSTASRSPSPRRGEETGRLAILEARAWLGTPYRHRASVRGEGADCLGLVRGVWRALMGVEPEVLPVYGVDWAERGEGEPLLDGLRRWMWEIAPAAARDGDVLVFRMRSDAPARHCAVMNGAGRMIHAYWGRAVVESWMGDWWGRRLAAAFTWPVAGREGND